MNTLRNFVVIFFLGIVVFLAGVMVGKSMRNVMPQAAAPVPGDVVSIPKPEGLSETSGAGKNAFHAHLQQTAKEAPLPLPLPISSANNADAESAPATEAEKPKEEVTYTFYQSLTDKKSKAITLDKDSAGAKAALPAKVLKKDEKKPAPAMPIKTEAGPTESRGLVLQVASYAQEGKARLLRNSLMREGYGKAVVVAADIPGKGTWYRVRIVEIRDKRTAKLLQERLKKQKSLQSFITR